MRADADGLTQEEAEKRLEEYGYNEIIEKKVNPLVKFFGYFWGPIPWMIEIAAVLSLAIHHWADFWIILILLLVNAVVGFWHEHKAENAIELLKKRLSLNAKVLRAGGWQVIPSRELVPGDIVRVCLGDIVPADIKLVSGDYVQVDESALTGESLPVEKHAADVAYSGSIIKLGEATAVVYATGMNTYFGKTAKLVEVAKTESHFQKAVVKIGDYLIVLAILLVGLIFMVAMFRHESLIETLQFALILTVAAIPVALPAVLSVTMAVGAAALAKKKVIVSKLAAIEEMAGMDVLCLDKTGTLTQNKLTLFEPVIFPGYEKEEVILLGTLASREEDRDPIDLAIINSAKDLLIKTDKYSVTSFVPFDPVHKRTEASIHDARGNIFKVSKGAPQVILSLVENAHEIGEVVNQKVIELAEKGYRALGVARTNEARVWEFAGIIPLYDPPRKDSAETLKTAKDMGVQVKMITGDHIAIAKETARLINLSTNILLSPSVVGKKDSELQRLVEEADGFAEVYPEHKYSIVESLQATGHIVGMTGDGVNDAPALKKADVGIAVENATDAARSAADIVLTLPGLSVIIDAIKESRKIFQRMNSYAIYRIAETIRVLLFMTFAILIFNFYPITALMIVLLALLNDLPIMSIAYDNVKYSDKPEKWDMRVVLGIATVLGIAGVISSFGIFYIGEEVLHLTRESIQSFIYLKLSVAGHLTLFVARTRGPFWSIKPSRILLLAIISTQIIATLIVVYGILLPPIGWRLALFVWVYALAWFIVNDYVKRAAYDLFDHGKIIFHR
ncbi:MAG: Potassium-transporting ATPase ATP-binding subunit [Candidatus Argoarchaeum ethanivorans]|uniref:Potassium-transporting ATPase ATP-binding subunit n=1 Tax=Candidatus Argoarchaeum ethanivorans TaxID=2608793 RepID=A0A811TBN6_9EURY|nr:MAG: Potassium-transporting ATPase ATP-binding subunit [Candidatus Argoarchaeum ethanivorans]